MDFLLLPGRAPHYKIIRLGGLACANCPFLVPLGLIRRQAILCPRGRVAHRAAETEGEMYLYVASAPTYGRNYKVKIGVSKDPNKRLRALTSSHDWVLKIIAIYEVERPFAIEALIKKRFKPHRILGHEMFSLPDEETMIGFIENSFDAEKIWGKA